METIGQLLERKGHDVWSIGPHEQVLEAIRLMAEKKIGALVVMDGDRLAGIVSERDYARKVILQGRSSRSTSVSEIMTADVVTVDPHQTVDHCMEVMTQRRIRHLPVVEEDRLVGVLSIGDLVASVIDDQKRQIESLEQYITS